MNMGEGEGEGEKIASKVAVGRVFQDGTLLHDLSNP